MDHGAFVSGETDTARRLPFLRKCQEFSRELRAVAATTTAARARVRGSVKFLVGCGARPSIARSRAFLHAFLIIPLECCADGDDGDGVDGVDD